MVSLVLPRIVIDTREQTPFPLVEYQTVVKGLKTGDYSLEGYEDHVAVERKSKTDAYGCVGGSRDRFSRCLERLSRLDRACIVIECSLADFAIPPERTKIDARMAVGSYISWDVQYGIRTYWCGAGVDALGNPYSAREAAERVTVRFLAGWMKHRSHIADKDKSDEEAAEKFKRENL